MKIGILQTGTIPPNLTPKHGDFPQIFERFLSGNGFTYELFPVFENEFPKAVNSCDGWLITGSEHGAYEDLPWIEKLEVFIRDVYTANIPICGICFGHQIMAQALGGKVAKFGNQWGLGAYEYQDQDGVKSRLLAVHQDQVLEAPDEAITTITSPYCKHAAFAYKGNAISFQPHPEFDDELVDDLIKDFKGTLFSREEAEKAQKTLYEQNDNQKFAHQIAEFFKTVNR